MNFITKTLDKVKENKRKRVIKETNQSVRKLDDYMKNKDEDLYNVAHMISDITNEGKGYLVMATMLVEDGDGKDILRHQAVISKGFKMEDIIPACDEHKKLAEKAIEKNDEYLKQQIEDNDKNVN